MSFGFRCKIVDWLRILVSIKSKLCPRFVLAFPRQTVRRLRIVTYQPLMSIMWAPPALLPPSSIDVSPSHSLSPTHDSWCVMTIPPRVSWPVMVLHEVVCCDVLVREATHPSFDTVQRFPLSARGPPILQSAWRPDDFCRTRICISLNNTNSYWLIDQ